jgi:hypothetical protein
MNNIVGSLLYHTDEVTAFELSLRLLNDYHLKEVHMDELPGVFHHAKVLEQQIRRTLPTLAQHLFSQLDISVL